MRRTVALSVVAACMWVGGAMAATQLGAQPPSESPIEAGGPTASAPAEPVEIHFNDLESVLCKFDVVDWKD